MKTLLRVLLTIAMVTFCALPSFAQAKKTSSLPKEQEETLELIGRPKGQRPDIVVFEPRFSQPANAYTKALEKIAKQGTRLPSSGLTMQAFTKGSNYTLLKKAEYDILPIVGVPLEKACSHIQTIFEMRRLQQRLNDDCTLQPLCFTLSLEVTPDNLQTAIDPLLNSKALIFVLPQEDNLFPTVVIWDRYVWPNHLVEYPVKDTQWIPTLAEITGIYPPAEIIAPSILPSLTGVGYQRPAEISPRHTNTDKRFVEIHLYEDFGELKVKRFPWMPDPDALIPSDRKFFDGSLPIPANALRLKIADHPQFLVVRSTLKDYELKLPNDFSLVIHVNGQPVYSRWESEEPHDWMLHSPENMGVSFYVWIPAGVDPAPVLQQFECSPLKE